MKIGAKLKALMSGAGTGEFMPVGRPVPINEDDLESHCAAFGVDYERLKAAVSGDTPMVSRRSPPWTTPQRGLIGWLSNEHYPFLEEPPSDTDTPTNNHGGPSER